jgi:ABC-type branched-subunit amino acid transport system ATPase component
MLNVKDVHVAYGQSEALHGISFEANKNETIAIMGRNGMGKTTLFKSLIGILPLKSGHIEVAGKEVSKDESYMRVAKGIAYVPQGRMIFPTLTVRRTSTPAWRTRRSRRFRKRSMRCFRCCGKCAAARAATCPAASSSSWRSPARW